MKTIKPESIALFCLLSGDVDLAKHLLQRRSVADVESIAWISEHNARLLTGPAGGAVALIHYLNEICHSRETAVNDAFCRTLTRGSLAIPQCHLLS